MRRESREEEKGRGFWMASEQPCHSLSLPCISSLSGHSKARWTLALELPGTKITSCSLIFLSQAKLKPHSLEPRSQEQPLLQPKQVQSSPSPSGITVGRVGQSRALASVSK